MDNIKDLSVLTTIDEDSLQKLFEKYKQIIYHNIFENIKSNKEEFYIDIEFGNLYIRLENDEIKFKFVPDENFQNTIFDIVLNKKDPLTENIEKTLRNRIMDTYKEMF